MCQKSNFRKLPRLQGRPYHTSRKCSNRQRYQSATQQQSRASKPSENRRSPLWTRPMHGAKNSIRPERKIVTPAAQNARSYDPETSESQPTDTETTRRLKLHAWHKHTTVCTNLQRDCAFSPRRSVKTRKYSDCWPDKLAPCLRKRRAVLYSDSDSVASLHVTVLSSTLKRR